MTKYIRSFIYLLTAYIIITIINSLLLYFEFAIAMAPDVIGFPNDWDLDVAIWILIGINFMISAFSYIHVGLRSLKTNCIAFNGAMIFLPFVFACIGCIMLDLGAHDGWDFVAYALNSSLGIFIMFVYDSFIKYMVAVLPSVCISIGYIIKVVKERKSKRKINTYR